jgi:hypothetical protein
MTTSHNPFRYTKWTTDNEGNRRVLEFRIEPDGIEGRHLDIWLKDERWAYSLVELRLGDSTRYVEFNRGTFSVRGQVLPVARNLSGKDWTTDEEQLTTYADIYRKALKVD